MTDGLETDPRWLSSLDAAGVCQRLFGLEAGAARSRLISLATDDRILRTWCSYFKKRPLDDWGNEDTYEDDDLLQTFWINFKGSHWHTSDWRNGLFTYQTMDWESEAHGVRFSGADLAAYKRRIAGSPTAATSLPRLSPPARREPASSQPPEVATSSAPIKDKIKPAALRTWILDFANRNPGSSFRKILQNARLAHPQLRVTERPVKDVIAELKLTLSVGNPLILRKNR
jgi:hypothetical protein